MDKEKKFLLINLVCWPLLLLAVILFHTVTILGVPVVLIPFTIITCFICRLAFKHC